MHRAAYDPASGRHKPAFYQNVWMDHAGFLYRGNPRLIIGLRYFGQVSLKIQITVDIEVPCMLHVYLLR